MKVTSLQKPYPERGWRIDLLLSQVGVRCIFVSIFCVVLASCIPFGNPQINGERLFYLEGRLGISTAEESYAVSFKWSQYNRTTVLDLWGALGMGHVRVSGVPERMSVKLPKGEQFRNINVREWMKREFGWSLPFRALPSWVRALPVPGEHVADVERDDQGRVTSFIQNGWLVEMKGFREVSGQQFPMRVLMRHGELRVKIICRNWAVSS